MRFSIKFKSLLALGGIFGLMGCMDIRAVDKKPDPPKATIKVQSHLRDKVHVEALEALGSYRVLFPRKIVRSSQTVQRTELDPESKSIVQSGFIHLMEDESGWFDASVKSGKIYSYAIPGLGDDLEVRIPLDVVIQGEVTPKFKDFEFLFATGERRPLLGRVIFEDNAVLTTDGQDLQWDLDTLVAHHAVIRSFSPEVQGHLLPWQSLRDGGKIQIEARKAIGDIRFELRGLDGAPGEDGKEPTKEMSGVPGKNGRDAVLGTRMQYQAGKNTSRLISFCQKQPTDGGKGGTGKKGFPGQPGQRGGDAAELVLKIQDDSEFRKVVESHPGRGGAGGKGGLGGAGGPGGKAGQVKGSPFRKVERCEMAKDGEHGPRGERGDEGLPGLEGRHRGAWEWKDGAYRPLL